MADVNKDAVGDGRYRPPLCSCWLALRMSLTMTLTPFKRTRLYWILACTAISDRICTAPVFFSRAMAAAARSQARPTVVPVKKKKKKKKRKERGTDVDLGLRLLDDLEQRSEPADLEERPSARL